MTPIANLEKAERESFTAFLYNLKSEITDTRLEFEYRRKILEYTKRFLLWLRKKKKINISDDYIDAIRIRDRRNTNWKMEQISADAYKFEDILKVAEYQPETLNLKRAKAAMLMSFLSGLRDGALVTMPFTDVYLQTDKPFINQMVEHGTHMKNSKNIRTALICNSEVSGMLETLREWQAIIRKQYMEQVGNIPAPNSVTADYEPYPYWFAPFSYTTGLIDFTRKSGSTRASGYRRDLILLCSKVGIEYHRPHTLYAPASARCVPEKTCKEFRRHGVDCPEYRGYSGSRGTLRAAGCRTDHGCYQFHVWREYSGAISVL